MTAPNQKCSIIQQQTCMQVCSHTNSLAAMRCQLRPPSKHCRTFAAFQFGGRVYKHVLLQCSVRLSDISTRSTLKCARVVSGVEMLLQVLWPKVFPPALQTPVLLALVVQNHVSLQCKSVFEHLITAITTSCLFDMNRCMQVTTFSCLESSQTVHIVAREPVMNILHMSFYSCFGFVYKVSTNKAIEHTNSTLADLRINLRRHNTFDSKLNIEVCRYR